MKSIFLNRVMMLTLFSSVAGCASVNPWCNSADCTTVTREMGGEGGVNGGTAVYNLKLDIPFETGFRPNRTISYSSRGGNDVMGMGWSISEYSSVFRCPATVDMDGFSSGVRYSSDDRLCADGAHLIPITGEYGKDGTRYRTEFHDNFELLEKGDINDPRSSFVATYDDGMKVIYSMPFIPEGSSAPLTWNETSLEDGAGDVINYNYLDVRPGEKLLSEVRFPGHDYDGTIQEGTSAIRYEYEPRPDVTSSFLAGGETLQTQRLADVVMGVERPKERGGFDKKLEFEFHYTQSQATGRSLLAGVMRCVYRGTNSRECDTPTVIHWNDVPTRFSPPQEYGTPKPERAAEPIWDPGDTQQPIAPFTRSYDYDGDGRVEFLYARPDAPAQLYFTDMTGKLKDDIDIGTYVHESGMQWTQSAGDLINIGAASLFGDVGGQFGFVYWNGISMGKPVTTGIPYSPTMLVADFDGQGYPDVLQLETGASGDLILRLYRNAYSSPMNVHFEPPMDIVGLPRRDYSFMRPIDLDGNGCEDALLIENGSVSKIILFSQDTHGITHARVLSPEEYGIHVGLPISELYFADINGDGLQDLVYVDSSGGKEGTWHYQFNTGNGFASPVDTGVADTRPSGAGHAGTLVTDLNNDGKDELSFPSVRLQDYCLTVGQAAESSGILCSGDELALQHPQLDLGIYRYGALEFQADADALYRPTLMPDAGIIAQANTAATGSLHGDGLNQVFSPFDPWFSNGGFRGSDGKLSGCPEKFGCGLHVDSNISGARPDSRDAPPDMVLEVEKSSASSYSWHYFPLANPIRGLYTVPPVGSPERYRNEDSFYFTSSMTVVGEYAEREAGSRSDSTYEYGAASYSAGGRGLEGFKWIVTHDLDNHLRTTTWYLQDFPFTGSLVAAWSELESSTGDDYMHAVPGKDYLYHVRFTYDCQGPADRPQSKQAGCLDQGDGSFLVRKRTSHEIKRDLTGNVISDQIKNFNYDADGNLVDDGIQ